MSINEKKIVRDFYSSWAQNVSLYTRWAAEHGMGYSELLILYALATKESMTQKAISDTYGLPKQTINAAIRDLKREGYVILEASERDKREKIVTLTGSGEAYTKKMLTPLFAAEERVCRNIGYERFIQMIETSDLFNTLFEREMERDEEK